MATPPSEGPFKAGLPRLEEPEPPEERESTKVETVPASEERSRRPFLVVLRGKNVGELHGLEHHNELLIGRAPEADLHIDETSVSRHHAKVTRTEDGFIIQDLHSANGTRVNGRPIVRQAIYDGDQIAVGANTVLKLEYQ